MNFKYNRKAGAVVLAAALLVGSLIGLLKGAEHKPAPGGIEGGSALVAGLVDDRAGVLDQGAVQAVNSLRQNTRATLMVQTLESTGSENVFDYAVNTANSLAREGRLREDTGMLLVLAIGDEDYAFVYGGDLFELDSQYDVLLYERLEPDFAKGRYSDAVEEFCKGLEKTIGSAGGSKQSSGDFPWLGVVIIVIVLLVVFSSASGRRRRRTSAAAGSYSYLFTGTGRRPPMPPRPFTPPRNSYKSRPSSGAKSSSFGGFSGGSRAGFGSGGTRSSSRSSFSGGGGTRSSSRSSFSGGSRGGFSGGSRGGRR